MKILVTGATGSLGSRLVGRLSSVGHHITGTGRKEFPGFPGTFSRGDLADPGFTRSLAAGQEAVVHCAALAAAWGRWEDFESANITATRLLLDSCREHGVRRFVHISTPSIYFAPRDRLEIREDEPIPAPATHYARSKLAAEKLVRAEAGVDAVMLRPRGIFGPTDQVILPKILRLLRKGWFPLLRGGEPLIDLTHVDNVIHAIELSLEKTAELKGSVFNISNGEPIAVGELVKLISQNLGLKVRLIPLPLPLAQGLAGVLETGYRLFGKTSSEPPLTRYGLGLLSYHQTLNLERARSQLGYLPKVKLREGILKTLEALR